MAPLQHLWLGTLEYQPAWELQRHLAAARAAGEIGDCVICLEHPPVYTLGRNTDLEHLGAGPDALRALGADCLEVDRGGSVTFHGPGQLVAYPILRLAERFPVADAGGLGDVGGYVRCLEAALIATAATCGVVATRRLGYPGAWVGEDKLAAIGVKLAAGVTQHGVALNVDVDLNWFAHVTPCGVIDGGVTTLAAQGVAGARPQRLAVAFAGALADQLGTEAAMAGPRLRQLCRQPATV